MIEPPELSDSWRVNFGQPTSGDRRAQPRTFQGDLASNIGSVIDLSPCGLRVLSPRGLSGSLDVELVSGQQRIIVRAEVVWQRWRGLRSREVGLRFLSVDPALAQALAQMAIEHRLRLEQAA